MQLNATNLKQLESTTGTYAYLAPSNLFVNSASQPFARTTLLQVQVNSNDFISHQYTGPNTNPVLIRFLNIPTSFFHATPVPFTVTSCL